MTLRYIAHEGGPPRLEELADCRSHIFDALKQDLMMVLHHCATKETTSGSVYVGVEGIVVLVDYIFDIDGNLAPLLPKDASRDFLTKAVNARNTSPSSGIQSGARASFLETDIGLISLVLLLELKYHEKGPFHASVSVCADIIKDATSISLQHETGAPDDGCEVLYGRAGLLYALLKLRKAAVSASTPVAATIKQLTSDVVFRTLVNEIVRRGRVGSQEYRAEAFSSTNMPALMWTWHGKRYIGGAHGVVGILQMLLSCPFQVIESHMVAIMETIDWLLDIQDAHGNWAHKASTSSHFNDNEMVQWCHGAPAILILLSTIMRRDDLKPWVTGERRDLICPALERGANLVYKHGFMKKGVGLCHGIGGNVFALLAAADAFHHTGDAGRTSRWLRRAVHLATLATDWRQLTEEGKMTKPDRPFSLYEGLAGMCSAWAAVIARLDNLGRPGMPAYDDVGPLQH